MDQLEKAYAELKAAIERKVNKDAKRRNKAKQIDGPRFKVTSGGMEVQEAVDGD